MPSRAEHVVRLERALRAVALAALAWLLWEALRGPALARVAAVDGADVAAALPAWTDASPAESLHVVVAAPLTPAERDWLAALRRAGTAVSWSGRLDPLAAAAEWSAGPSPALRVRVAAADGPVSVHDSLGELASERAARGGAAFALPAAGSGIASRSGATTAVLATPAEPMVRGVAVLGRAGWEAKFVIAALEERGWPVDARLSVAPRLAVTQGRPLPLDTARHSAVVVSDSVSDGEAALIAAFARRGGGVVIASAAAARVLRAIAPAAIEGRERATALAVSDAAPRTALGFDRLAPEPGAIVLEQRGRAVAAAARRVVSGRVVQVGYDETWRWRFSGGDDAPEAHRAWWNAIVAAAAYRPVAAEPWGGDPAPLASMAFALGTPASVSPGSTGTTDRRPFIVVAFGVFLAALLVEWASRRLRGAP